MIIRSLIGLIILTLTNFILIIDSPFQIAGDLIQNLEQQVYASLDGEDDENGDGSDNDDSNDDSNELTDNDGSNDDINELTDNDKDKEEISVDESDESDNSNYASLAEDSLNEQLTAENPPPIKGEIVTRESTLQFENRDNLQIAPPSTDDQALQAPPITELLNPDFKILKDPSTVEQFPPDPIKPQMTDQLNPNVKLEDILTQHPPDPIKPQITDQRNPNVKLEDILKEQPPPDPVHPQIVEQLNPFVDLDDLLKEQFSIKSVQPIDPIQSPSYGTVDPEDTEEIGIVQQPSIGLTDAVPPKTPPDIFISGDTVVIPGPSYSEEDPSLEECVVENCDIPLYKDEICRNGIDDDNDGRVDEEPYCTVIPGKSKAAPPTTGTLTPEQSTGPSPFGSK